METDENDLFGRECPSCGIYFKIKPVTDLTATQGICPYCGHTEILGDFLTHDQREYLLSVAARELLESVRDSSYIGSTDEASDT